MFALKCKKMTQRWVGVGSAHGHGSEMNTVEGRGSHVGNISVLWDLQDLYALLQVGTEVQEITRKQY